MKYNITLLLLFSSLLTTHAQDKIRLQVSHEDYAIWAYRQHTDICMIIADNLKKGKLSGYKDQNIKESKDESLKKIQEEYAVFISTNMDDPTQGRDSTIRAEKPQDYHQFIFSDAFAGQTKSKSAYIEYILVHPFKDGKMELKLKKSDLMLLLTLSQKEYLTRYSAGKKVCIDSIPFISRRLFAGMNMRLYNYAQLPTTKLFKDDSLKSTYSQDEKTSRTRNEFIAWVNTNINDPTIGKDTLIEETIDISDTSRRQSMLMTMKLSFTYTTDMKLEVISISTGINSLMMGLSHIMLEYGLLPYNAQLPFSQGEMLMLNSIVMTKATDKLNNFPNCKDSYEMFFLRRTY